MIQFAVGASRHATVRGTDIHYQDFSLADDRKPGLLFVHGMWAHLHWWDHIIPYFTDRFRVLAMDLGGMGDSGYRAAYTARGFAEEIIGVIENANMASATIVAHSLGGTPTAFACHMRPDLVDRAVIIDSRLYLPAMPALRPDEIEQAKVKQKLYPRAEDAIDRYRLIPPGGPVDPAILRHIAVNGLRETADGWVWKFDPGIDPLLDSDPDRVIPAGITTPIDYIYGEVSDVVSKSLAASMQAYLPGCGVPIEIPGGHHHILLEQPEILVGVLRGLFARPASAFSPASGT